MGLDNRLISHYNIQICFHHVRILIRLCIFVYFEYFDFDYFEYFDFEYFDFDNIEYFDFDYFEYFDFD